MEDAGEHAHGSPKEAAVTPQSGPASVSRGLAECRAQWRLAHRRAALEVRCRLGPRSSTAATLRKASGQEAGSRPF